MKSEARRVKGERKKKLEAAPVPGSPEWFVELGKPVELVCPLPPHGSTLTVEPAGCEYVYFWTQQEGSEQGPWAMDYDQAFQIGLRCLIHARDGVEPHAFEAALRALLGEKGSKHEG